MHIMVIPSWYASSRKKVHGSFFKEQFKALSKHDIKISVAYNEIWPITSLGKIHEKRGLNFEVDEGLHTYRYKDYNFFPKNKLMFKSFNKRMDKLYKEIVKKEGKVDVIHAHSAFWGAIAGTYISQKYNIPLVITEHSSLKYAKYAKESYKPYIFNAYEKADSLIAVGSGLKEELLQYVKRDIEIIPNMVDLDIFKISEEAKKGNDFRFFSCGYLEEGKGMELLIDAFTEEFKGSKVILRIGADGSLKPKLQEQINNLNMQDQIKLLGALSRIDVAKEMQECDSFVLASEHETFGVVYIEALASGKPIIGTYNGGAEDIIRDFNGLIIEKRNKEELKKALKKIINNYDYYDKYLIREKAILSYSEEVLVEKLKGVYKKVYER